MLDVLLQLLQQQVVHEITKRGISVQRSEPLRNLLLRDAFRLSDIAQIALSKHADLVDQKLSAVRPLRFRKLAMSGSTDWPNQWYDWDLAWGIP